MKNRAWRGTRLNIRFPADILLIPGKTIPNGRNGYGRCVCTCVIASEEELEGGKRAGFGSSFRIETMTPEITGRF